MIDIVPQRSTDTVAIPWLFSGVRLTEGGQGITSGSLRDLPDYELGTANWWSGSIAPATYRQISLGKYTIELTETARAYTTPDPEPTTDTSIVDYEMAQLEVAAQTGDESSFLAVQTSMNWQNRSPEVFARAVQLALSAGAFRAARSLSAIATTRYPDHAELRKYARVLAPPKVTRSTRPADPTLKANRDWLMVHGDQYRGRWVALRNGELVDSASSLQLLSDQLRDTNGLLITKVF